MIVNGWISNITHCPSEHFDERSDPLDISLLVIHNISLPPSIFGNQFVEDFFCGRLDCSLDPFFSEIAELRVSSHLYIKRCGQIIQFVPLNKRAWHAGESNFQGRKKCNDFSIGIELEGTDDTPYEKIQYEKLCELTQLLLKNYPKISLDNIVGHSDIAPGRKTDPGESFDWQWYRKKLMQSHSQ